jgi:hypothetical protein
MEAFTSVVTDTCAYCGAVLEDEESKDRGSHKECRESYWAEIEKGDGR